MALELLETNYFVSQPCQRKLITVTRIYGAIWWSTLSSSLKDPCFPFRGSLLKKRGRKKNYVSVWVRFFLVNLPNLGCLFSRQLSETGLASTSGTRCSRPDIVPDWRWSALIRAASMSRFTLITCDWCERILECGKNILPFGIGSVIVWAGLEDHHVVFRATLNIQKIPGTLLLLLPLCGTGGRGTVPLFQGSWRGESVR